MSQTAVTAPLIGSPGDLADNYTATDGDIVSAANEEASAPIVLGTMVKLGTGAGLVKKLTDSHEIPFGIVTRAQFASPTEVDALEVDTDVFYDAANPGVMLGIGRSGRYCVLIEESVDFDDPVHVRAVATSGEVAGAFGKTDNGNDSFDVSAFCRYTADFDVDGDTGFGVAVVEINMGLASLTVTDS